MPVEASAPARYAHAENMMGESVLVELSLNTMLKNRPADHDSTQASRY
jgi:hypothetical protein